MEVELQKRVEKMYKILERDNKAFFMDATDIYIRWKCWGKTFL